MRLRPTPSTLPPELSSRFGEPELVFGPNMRFRVVASLCGLIFVVMSVILFLMGLGARGLQLPLADWVSGQLAVPLVILGVVILIGTRLVPLNWVFLCPGGVIRTRGDASEGIGWAEVERFEDATVCQKGVTIRQCRLVLKDGRECGFLADNLVDYPRLAEALSRKVSERMAPPGESRTSAAEPDRPRA
jgi:hypothetical protein